MVMIMGSFVGILFLGTILFIMTMKLHFCFIYRRKLMRYNVSSSQIETYTTGGNPSIESIEILNRIGSNPSQPVMSSLSLDINESTPSEPIISSLSLEDSEFNVNSILECWIDEIDGSTIYARGRNINGLGSEISFEIDIKNIKENDKELVKEGSVFIVKIEEGNLDINFQRYIKEKERHSNESYIKNRLAIIEGSDND